MPAKVILTVTQGNLEGKQFVFDERTTCILGRAEDCFPQVPDDKKPPTVSRHHCLLDINPPDTRVRDFGSLNGTYVNGKIIGQREEGMTPEEGAQMNFLEHDLNEGDELKLEETVFRISLFVPTLCAECSGEIPEEQKAAALIAPDLYQCAVCQEEAENIKRREMPTRKSKVCAGCGKDVAKEMGDNRQGDYLCSSCRAEPTRRVESLLNTAKAADNNLSEIQGYEILKELGRGGMGAIYLASHTLTKSLVALKVMLPQVAVDEYAKEAFRREAENTRVLSLLKHPNIVELRNWGFLNGAYFFTLEYCEGDSVADLMRKRGGKLSIDEASQIILQALNGLEYAHHAPIPYVKLKDGSFSPGHGLVHRDIKPANIFLASSGKGYIAKIGDYGLSKALDLAGLSGQTRTGTAAGTPYFLPRQQVLNFRYSKPEVDVWAMAASLYHMLTGYVPRDFTKGKDGWLVVVQDNAVPIRDRDSSIPKQLAEVIDLALRDKPDIHFKTAAELMRALESVL